MLEGHIKDNYYASFHTAGINDAEKTKLPQENQQSQWTVKYRSRTPGQGACLKGISRTITMQGLTLAGIRENQTST